ncbi:MAG: hypothetical protein K8S54_14765 [Spirochaetia bacterium]|nr:hypothetical protein [Spirochaetia bacterium]
MEHNELFKQAIESRSCSSDWNCHIAQCVMQNVERQRTIRGSVAFLAITVAFSTGLTLTGQTERIADAAVDIISRDAQNPLRVMHEPLVSDEMDLLIQVAMRE